MIKILFNADDNQYFSSNHFGSSDLKTLSQDGYNYWFQKTIRSKEATKSMDFGTLVHAFLLEPEKAKQKYILSTDNRLLKTKEDMINALDSLGIATKSSTKKSDIILAHQGTLENAGFIIKELAPPLISPDHERRLSDILHTLPLHDKGKLFAKHLQDILPEVAILAEIEVNGEKVPVRAKLDAINMRVVTDVKMVTSSIFNNAFKLDYLFRDNGYLLQAGGYMRVLDTAKQAISNGGDIETDDPDKLEIFKNYLNVVNTFSFLMIESEAPHRVLSIDMNHFDLQSGGELWEEAIKKHLKNSNELGLSKDKIWPSERPIYQILGDLK